MRMKLFTLSALATAMLITASCSTEPTKPAAKAKPALMTGATAKMLAQTCEGCHGTNGNSSGPASPSLAGMSADYLVETMEEFKSGDTKTTIMTRIAKGYSDDEFESMAAYFAKQKPIAAKQSFDAALARKGKALHDDNCEKCHSDGGTNVEEDSGLLAGQWAPYLRYTLTDYRSGARDISKKMKKKLDAVVDKEGHAGIEALVQYYASQQ